MGRLQVDCAMPSAANLSFCVDNPEDEEASFAQASAGVLKIGYDVATRNVAALVVDLAVVAAMVGLEIAGPPDVIVLNKHHDADTTKANPHAPPLTEEEAARDEAAKNIKDARDAARRKLEEEAQKKKVTVDWGGTSSLEATGQLLFGGAAATMTARLMTEVQAKDVARIALPAAAASATGVQVNAMSKNDDAAERAARKAAADAAKAEAEAAKRAMQEAAKANKTKTKTHDD